MQSSPWHRSLVKSVYHLVVNVISRIPSGVLEAVRNSYPRSVVQDCRFIHIRFINAKEIVVFHLRLQSVRITKMNAFTGGSADVHLGRLYGKDVAVKVFRTTQTDQERKVKRIVKEYTIMASLRPNPHIIGLRAIYFDERNIPCIVTPWMKNGTLADHIKLNPSTTQRLLLVQQIASGMLFLKSSNVVHGDLKSNNILIDQHGSARIADFGLSRFGDAAPAEVRSKVPAYVFLRLRQCTGIQSDATTSSDFTGSGAGSCRWMAPELLIADSSSKPTFESDVFAFAMVIYEIYSGHIPFQDYNNFMAILCTIQGRRPDRPALITGDIWSIAEQSWDANPSLRPSINSIHDELLGHDTSRRSSSSCHAPTHAQVHEEREAE